MRQERVLSAGGMRARNLADAFRKTPVWKILVRDGRGNVWLRLPEEIIERIPPKPSLAMD
jgi:hypothetical protein